LVFFLVSFIFVDCSYCIASSCPSFSSPWLVLYGRVCLFPVLYSVLSSILLDRSWLACLQPPPSLSVFTCLIDSISAEKERWLSCTPSVHSQVCVPVFGLVLSVALVLPFCRTKAYCVRLWLYFALIVFFQFPSAWLKMPLFVVVGRGRERWSMSFVP
jgi:hypothetical protein